MYKKEKPGATEKGYFSLTDLCVSFSSLIVATGPAKRKLNRLPDPEGRYSSLPQLVYEETTINVPDVRDGNGAIIHPEEYELKLKHGTKVAVEVIFKL
jgi:hypothetical protein